MKRALILLSALLLYGIGIMLAGMDEGERKPPDFKGVSVCAPECQTDAECQELETEESHE